MTRQVSRANRWRYNQSKKRDFVDAMCSEIFRRGVIVLRVHVAGDFYSPGYTDKWVQIASRSPQCRFFAYTRSWRVAKIEPHLRAFAALENVRLWYSADRLTGTPKVPDGVRVAWLQDTEAVPEGGDLTFQVRRLRRLALPVFAPVCEQETPRGKAAGVNCSNCRLCWDG